MAEHSGFFNGDQEYGQDEFNRYFDNIYESGVSVQSNNELTFKVTSSDMNVSIDSGFAIIKGFYLYNDSIKQIKIENPSTFKRIDRIVIKLDKLSKKVSIEVKKGEEGSNSKPPLLQRDETTYELSLAQAIVNLDSVSIVDERFNKDLCGSIRPKNLSEFNTMVETWSKRFEDWFNKLQAPVREIFIQSNQPIEAKEGDIWL